VFFYGRIIASYHEMGMYFESTFLLQTDDEWEDELGRGEQGISISQLLSEKRYKG
jgi:hypothetical protein